ncbi:MAG: CHAT domain-containing protein [Acidobacteriota bacterium]
MTRCRSRWTRVAGFIACASILGACPHQPTGRAPPTGPSAAVPEPLDPVSLDPVPLDSVSLDPGPLDSVSLDPVSLDPGPLDPAEGLTLEHPLGPDVPRHHLLRLETEQALELVGRASAVDLTLELTATDDAPLLSIDLLDGRETRFVVVAPTAGVYELRLDAWSGPSGSYDIDLTASRRARPVDLKRATMERLFAEAEQLRRRGDRSSVREAVARDLAALERARALGARDRAAEIHHHLGWLFRRHLEEMEPAIEHYRAALDLFEDLDDRRRQSEVLNNLGRCHFVRGDVLEARELWSAALALKRATGDRAGEAAALSNLALAARYRGDSSLALELYDQCLGVLAELQAPRETGRALNNRARLAHALGDSRQALADLERGLRIARSIDDRRLEAILLTASGEIRQERGELERALSDLERALRLREETGTRRGRASTLDRLAAVHRALGRPADAEQALHQGLALALELRAPRAEARLRVALGELGGADRPERARSTRDHLGSALEIFRRLGDPWGESRALEALARLEAESGRRRIALELIEASIDRVESLRHRAASEYLRATYLAGEQDRYDLAIDLHMALHRDDPIGGHDRRALAVSEAARARSLLDRLSAAESVARAGIPDRVAVEAEIERKMDLIERERLRLLERPEPTRRLKALDARLDELLREHRAARARRLGAHDSRTRPPRSLDADAIQARLDRDDRLLHFRLGEGRSHLWLVGPRSLDSFELPPRAVIESAARRISWLASNRRRELRAPAVLAFERLADQLLGAAAPSLDATRLLITGDSGLDSLPFAALPDPRSATREPLVAAYEVVYLPSASVAAALHRRDRPARDDLGTIAILADPVFDLADSRLAPTAGRTERSLRGRRLLHTRDEAMIVSHLAEPATRLIALGFDATRELAIDPRLARYRIVHFATHGMLDPLRPEMSRLVFSRVDADGRPRDGSLFAHQIRDLDLPVELVVLGACESALGAELRGEGLIGLTHAFLDAGAAQVLASLWPVDDEATAELMSHFYRALLIDGEAPAQSLRTAQLALRSHPRWSAPYFWAGFVLHGAMNPRQR